MRSIAAIKDTQLLGSENRRSRCGNNTTWGGTRKTRKCDKQFSNKMKNVKFSLFFNLFRGLYRTLKVLIVNKEIFTKIRSMGR